MKKLYGRKSTVHPSPSIKPDNLSFLPAAILTLAAALSPQDREVLAYLISSDNNTTPTTTNPCPFLSPKNKHNKTQNSLSLNNNNNHLPLFRCDCFSCYTSYWVRWDSSPNRQLIHEIIEAFEDRLVMVNDNNKKRKNRRKKGCAGVNSNELTQGGNNKLSSGCNGGGESVNSVVEDETEKGSVRSFVSFIGERIWGVWG